MTDIKVQIYLTYTKSVIDGVKPDRPMTVRGKTSASKVRDIIDTNTIPDIAKVVVRTFVFNHIEIYQTYFTIGIPVLNYLKSFVYNTYAARSSKSNDHVI